MTLASIHRSTIFDDHLDWFYDSPFDFHEPSFDFELRPLSLVTTPSFLSIREPSTVRYSTKTTSTRTRTRSRSRSVSWSSTPLIDDNFRVEFNVDGFRPETIRTFVESGKIIVEARHEARQFSGDYSVREIRKSFELPSNADPTRLVSSIKPDNTLVIEVPLRTTENSERTIVQVERSRKSSISPIIDVRRKFQMSFDLKGFTPEQIKVTVRHNHLIVQAERRFSDGNRSERSSFYKTISLPAGVNADQVNSYLTGDGTLNVEIPYY